jgi:hypothetical protein
MPASAEVLKQRWRARLLVSFTKLPLRPVDSSLRGRLRKNETFVRLVIHRI